MALKQLLSKVLLVMLFCGLLVPSVMAQPTEKELNTELIRYTANLAGYEKILSGLPALKGDETKDVLTSQLNTVLALEKKALADKNNLLLKYSEAVQLTGPDSDLSKGFAQLDKDFVSFLADLSAKKTELEIAIQKIDQANFDKTYGPLEKEVQKLIFENDALNKKVVNTINNDLGPVEAKKDLAKVSDLKQKTQAAAASVSTALNEAAKSNDPKAVKNYKDLATALGNLISGLDFMETSLNDYLEAETKEDVADLYKYLPKIQKDLKTFEYQYSELKVLVDKIVKLTPDAPNEQLTLKKIETLRTNVFEYQTKKVQPILDKAKILGDEQQIEEFDRAVDQAQEVIDNCDKLKAALTGQEPEADTDKDGIADTKDNCKNTANPDQKDTDADGLGDACEEAVPPAADADKDGIADATDNCPNNANLDQKDTDGDKLGDVCDANPTTPLLPEEQQYKEWKQKYNDYEDDYDTYSDKYKDAVSDKDDKDIKKYKNKLEDLDDNLDDLESDLEDMIDDLEDTDDDKYEDLIDDLDNLYDDVKDLREKIAITLGKKAAETAAETVTVKTPVKTEESKVTVQTLSTLPAAQTTTAANANAPAEANVFSWASVQENLWLIAGIVVLVAVIIFLLALLL